MQYNKKVFMLKNEVPSDVSQRFSDLRKNTESVRKYQNLGIACRKRCEKFLKNAGNFGGTCKDISNSYKVHNAL